MRVAVHPDLTATQLLARLPKQYRRRPLPALPRDGNYSLIIIGGSDTVVRRVTLERALDKAGIDLAGSGDKTAVVCGREFTTEARELLLAGGGVACSLADYGWTDARYLKVHERLSNIDRGRPKAGDPEQP